MKVFIVTLFFSLLSQLVTAKGLEIMQVLPQGSDVTQATQITFKFNKDMVPLGKMARKESEIPISISPKVNCQWRWLDQSTLACQITGQDKLIPATKYRITVEKGFESYKREKLANKRTFSFLTIRPKVTREYFSSWEAPGQPVFNLFFNQPVGQKSVEDSIYFLANKKKYSVKVLPTNLKPKFLKFSKDRSFKDYTDKEDEIPKNLDDIETGSTTWRVTSEEGLPEGVSVNLMVRAGLVSVFGPLKGKENQLIKKFKTIPKFKFLGVSCNTKEGNKILFLTSVKNDDKCSPINGDLSLNFSSPVLLNDIKPGITITPDLTGGNKDVNQWENTYSYSQKGRAYDEKRPYSVSLPSYFKAEETYKISLSDITDEFGRKLSNNIEVEFSTGPRPSDFRLNYTKAVIEGGIGNDIPIYVTNINKLNYNYSGLTAEKGFKEQVSKIDTKVPRNLSVAVPLKLEELLGGNSGAVFGHFSSDPIQDSYQSHLFAQATNFQVFAKVGHYNTVVWVSDLRTGESVKGASVELYTGSYEKLPSLYRVSNEVTTGKDGVSILAGLKDIDPTINLINSWDIKRESIFIKVTKGKEFALLPLSYDFKVETYELFSLGIDYQLREANGHLKVWGFTPQGLYRAGDKIDFKIFVRDQDVNGLVSAPKGTYHLVIEDPLGNVAYENKKAQINEFGTVEGSFKTKKDAPVGWYQFSLYYNDIDQKSRRFDALKVLVSDFRPSSFKVTSTINKEVYQDKEKIKVDTIASLYSGGPYIDADNKVTIKLLQIRFTSKHPKTSTFTFEPYLSYPQDIHLSQTNKKTDKNGNAKQSFKIDNLKINYGTLYIESAVRDDRGKDVASLRTATYLGIDRFVGLKNTKWTYKAGDEAVIETVVVDHTGRPVKDTNVSVEVSYKKTYSTRVKSAGNTFETKYTTEDVEVSKCEIKSTEEIEECRFTPKDAGAYYIKATITDTKGKKVESEISSWVTGPEAIVWGGDNTNALTLVSEKSEYKVGEKAKYLVKNPFPGANALVTVERYGVIKQWVQEFESSTPIVEFEVEEEFLPGFYVSVVVFSPRVSKLNGFGKLDLGKPTFRIGYQKGVVLDDKKLIDITIKPEREVYKPRETAKVTIKADEKYKGKTDKFELAIAVLDESVFDMIKGGQSYFDPYKGLYELEELDVVNYSLLTRLIGRQKFEKKGANQGGDGAGADPAKMRSLFKFLAYWNPSVQVKNGEETSIEIPLPDNLTSWKIISVANDGAQKVGLGHKNFKVNQKTEIQALLPNQVAEGDKFNAKFSVMNRAEKEREIKVKIVAAGNIEGDEDSLTLEEVVKVAPFERKEFELPVKAMEHISDKDFGEGMVSFLVKAGDSIDKDGIYKKIPVKKNVSLMKVNVSSSTTNDIEKVDIKVPEKIRSDVGSVGINFSPTILGNMEGAFRYMKDYPYQCWEQKLSKGVMASFYEELSPYVNKEVIQWDGYLDLVKKTLDSASEFQAPNGGMCFFIPKNDHVSPYLSAYTALAFNWLKSNRKDVPLNVEKKLSEYLKELLRKDNFPFYFDTNKKLSLRAMIINALTSNGTIRLDDALRFEKSYKDMSVFAQAQILEALNSLIKKPHSKDTKDEVVAAKIFRDKVALTILGNGNNSSSKFVVSESNATYSGWLLTSDLKTNCSVLSAFSNLSKNSPIYGQIKEIPLRMINFINGQRIKGGAWGNTQENIFCMQAFQSYSKVYEQDTPDMKVVGLLGDEKLGEVKLSGFKVNSETKKEALMTRPMTKELIGKPSSLVVKRKGKGRLYYSGEMIYASDEKIQERENAGIDIRKEYYLKGSKGWKRVTGDFQAKRGDVFKIGIYISVPAERSYVVVDDPIPGCFEPVNTDLATESTMNASGDFKLPQEAWYHKLGSWLNYGRGDWAFYHRELRHDRAVFYSESLNPGNYFLTYTVQTIASGQFNSMPVKAEEMYNESIFGLGMSRVITVNSK